MLLWALPQIALNPTHISAPRLAMISTAMAAYKFGRVIRLQQTEVDAFIAASRISPGSLEHLYPDSKREISEIDASRT